MIARFERLTGRKPTDAELASPKPRRLDALSVANQLLALGQTIIAARALGFDVVPAAEGLELDVRCTQGCKHGPREEAHRWVWEVSQPAMPDSVFVGGQEEPGETADEERAELAALDHRRLMSVLEAHLDEHHGPPAADTGHNPDASSPTGGGEAFDAARAADASSPAGIAPERSR